MFILHKLFKKAPFSKVSLKKCFFLKSKLLALLMHLLCINMFDRPLHLKRKQKHIELWIKNSHPIKEKAKKYITVVNKFSPS